MSKLFYQFLGRNALKDEGWNIISECLKDNDVIEELDIRNGRLNLIGGNEFSEETLNAIKTRQLTTACHFISD